MSIVAVVGSVVAAKLVLDWRRAKAIEEARVVGFAAHAEGDHMKVLESLGPLLRRNSDDLELVRALAFSRARLEETDGSHLPRAAVLLQRVVELDPDDLEAQRELLRIYPQLGFLRETLDTSDAILEAAPDDEEAMEARIQVLAAMGRWAEASEMAATLVQADPDEERWKQLQVSTALAGGLAVEEVIELASDWPKSSFADGLDDLVLAALLQISGQPDAAAELAAASVAKGAGNGERLAAMLSILGDLGRAEQANALIRDFASRGDPGDETFATLASTWALGAGRLDFLEELFEAAPADSGARAEYLIPLCLMTMLMDPSASDRWLESLRDSSAIRRELERTRQSILDTDLVRRAGDAEAMVRVLSTARRSDATVPELLSAAMVAVSVGDSVSARRFAASAEAEQSTLLGGMLLVEALSRQGENLAAIEAVVSVLGRHPTRLEPSVVLVSLWAWAPAIPSGLLERIRGVTRADNPLQLAERIVEDVGMLPAVATAFAAAAIDRNRQDLLEDAVVALVSADPPPVEAMLNVRDQIANLAPNLADSLRSRLVQVASDDSRVLAISIDPREEGTSLVLQLRDLLPLDHPDPAVRQTAWMAAISRVQSLPDPEFRSLAAEAIAACPGSALLVGRVLYDPRTWGDRDLARKVVDRTGELRGLDSAEYLIAEASWQLQHNREDRSVKESLIAKLNDQWLADPDSFLIGTTLLRLMIDDSASDPQIAIRIGRQILAARPDALEIYPIMISLLQSQGMLADAERLLAEFEGKDREGTVSARQRAAIDFQRGDLEDLVRSLTTLAARSGDAADAISLGIASETTGDLVGAERAYREALDDERTAAEAIIRLGGVLRRLGRLEEFERILQERGGALTELQREISMAEMLLAGGDDRSAIVRLSAAAERNPESAAAWEALSKAALAVGDAKTAGDAAVRGLLLLPESQEFQSIAMAAAIEDPSWADVAILREDRTGKLPTVLVEGVRILRSARGSNGRLSPNPSLLRSSKDLCSRFGDSINSWRLAVALHQAAGQAAEAKSIADAAARRFPLDPDPVKWQVLAATSLGEVDQASALCIEWRRRSFPDVRRVDETHAAIELARNRPDLALPLLTRHRDLIVKEAEDQPGPYRAMLASLMMTGDVRGAAELERSNLAASEASRVAWATIAAMAPYQQGLEAMSILESVSPSDSFGRARMVSRWVAFHERHPNGRGLERAKALLPRSGRTLSDYESRIEVIARSDIERASGDASAARSSLQSVIASYPPNIQERAKTIGSLAGAQQQELFREIEPLLYARNNLAMLLVEQDRSLDEALALVEECVEIIPGNPDLRDTEAQVLLKLGRLSEAEQSSLMAIRAYPQEASVLLTGAEILAASGRVEDARQLLQRIRDIVAREPWPSRQVEDRLSRATSAIDSSR